MGSRSGVGIFSVGMQINEAAVTPVKSIATVQYAHMANTEDKTRNVLLTGSLIKLALLVTMAIACVVVIIPEDVYLWIFSEELRGLKGVLNYLFWGMGALAVSSIIAHYFSGTGQYKHNTIAALVALGTLAILGYLYIERDGIIGAAWVSATAYILQALYLLLVFVIDEKPDLKALFGKGIDWKLIRESSHD